ncbi:NYN domain-containing protein [Litoreibacter albidus]|uniref:Zc3h12a-like Ribonuclease NYN domain-containing protein n=1 Tax=Litoreibacter albidus TaxID=670155 RepID=A0A1H2V812_9RHOB|nr:hypothetical protein [Litoreibacter albidus]SDW64508.1 Zc3h12a-like Ribonuclease NYN domain-containing protein [Litoreibacter albidus]
MIDFLLIAVICFSIIVVWFMRRKQAAAKRPVKPRKPPKPREGARARPTEKHILIDGSNLMYWNGASPSIQPVQEAVCLLLAQGMTPGVMFDANAGYRVAAGYKDDADFAYMLGLPADQVLVANKNVPADQDLLKAAREFGARIVTNDLFRDWADEFPEVRERGRLVHGGYHKGKLWLDFDGSRARVDGARHPGLKKG